MKCVPETYSPTVGMRDVTQANDDILINLSAERRASTFSSSVSNRPTALARDVEARRHNVLFNDVVKADPQHGNHIAAAIPAGHSGEQIRLSIATADGKELIAAKTKVK